MTKTKTARIGDRLPFLIAKMKAAQAAGAPRADCRSRA
jgi:hypothetical protein